MAWSSNESRDQAIEAHTEQIVRLDKQYSVNNLCDDQLVTKTLDTLVIKTRLVSDLYRACSLDLDAVDP